MPSISLLCLKHLLDYKQPSIFYAGGTSQANVGRVSRRGLRCSKFVNVAADLHGPAMMKWPDGIYAIVGQDGGILHRRRRRPDAGFIRDIYKPARSMARY